jgi:CRP-like cAMP-binding protein
VCERGATPTTVEFLLDGRVSAIDATGAHREIAAPAAVAFEEVIEGAAMRATVTSVSPVISLSLTTDEFLALLSENVQLAEGIFRLLLERQPGWQTVVHSRVAPELARKASAGLQPVDRILLLQASPLLAHATAAQLLRLSAIARPVPLKAGIDPMAGGTGAAILIVLSGALRAERPGADVQTAIVGDVVGIYETLCGAPLSGRTTVTTDGSALRVDRSDVFDLLADHTDLLQGIFSGMLRATAPSAAPRA